MPLHKQRSARPPSLNSPRGLRSEPRKNTTHHIQPKQTSRATQIFQLEPEEGGQEMDLCSLSPAIPQPSSADLVEIHRALTKRLRTFLACVSTQMMEELNDNSFLRHGACLQSTCQSVPLVPSHTQSIS